MRLFGEIAEPFVLPDDLTLIGDLTLGGDLSVGGNIVGGGLGGGTGDQVVLANLSVGGLITTSNGLDVTGANLDVINQNINVTGGNVFVDGVLLGGGGGGGGLLHVRDEKPSNTHGGGFSSGAWRTRDLNTVKTNDITGASLASNQITLPAGTYNVHARAPAMVVNLHKAKLRNITDSTDELIGSSEYTSNGIISQSNSWVVGRITIAATKVFELQHRCQTFYVFGLASSFGVVEVYAEVWIEKIA